MRQTSIDTTGHGGDGMSRRIANRGSGGRLGLLSLAAATVLSLSLAEARDVSAAGGTLTANPNPVILAAPATQSNVALTWNSGDPNTVGFVRPGASCPTAGPSLTKTASGTVQAPVTYKQTNDFVLCDAAQTQLASVTVTVQRPGSVIPIVGPVLGGGVCITCIFPTPTLPITPPLPAPLVLKPTKTLSSVSSYMDEGGTLCGSFPGNWPVVLDLVALSSQGEMVYGYQHSYSPGAQPLPCWQMQDNYWRGGVGFDMNAVNQYILAHGIKSATLQYQEQAGSDWSAIPQVTVASDAWASRSEYTLGDIPTGALRTPAPQGGQNGETIDLTAILALEAGLGANNPDMHFVFVGSDETFPHDNNQAHQILGNFTLTLTADH